MDPPSNREHIGLLHVQPDNSIVWEGIAIVELISMGTASTGQLGLVVDPWSDWLTQCITNIPEWVT